LGNEDVLIPTDLREWITPSDSGEIRAVVRSLDIPGGREAGSFDKRARVVWQYVAEAIEYRPDAEAQGRADFWQFPAETIALKSGDCEDCAFLLATLMLSAGISPFCVRLVFGAWIDKSDNATHHAWPIYRDEGGIWRVLESTLNETHKRWRSADTVSEPDRRPRYHPEICLNQHHVWVIGRRRIKNAASHLRSRERSHKKENR